MADNIILNATTVAGDTARSVQKGGAAGPKTAASVIDIGGAGVEVLLTSGAKTSANSVSVVFATDLAATTDGMVGSNIVAEAATVWNGATFDRERSASAANLAAASGLGVELTTGPGNWTTVSAPAVAIVATTTRAAGAAGVRHVCNAITATLAAGATAQTPINVYLRDGATGVGAILWAGTLSAPVNGSGVVGLSGLNIFGSVATVMTLEFSAASVAGCLEAVTLGGYDAS